MRDKYVIGVDLGGTKILTAIADLSGTILAKVRVFTEADKGEQVLIDQIKDTVYQVVEEIGTELNNVKGIGLGCPGPLNIEQGIIYHTPNLPLKDVSIVQELEDLGVPIFLENDANAAALGEKWFGTGQEASDLIYITVSTGIGGGIILNNEIFHGASDGAGEIGHVTIIPDSDRRCGCGNYGCWETVASGTALSRLGREAVKAGASTMINELVDSYEDINGAIIAQAASKGDKLAQELMNHLGYYLGVGFANLINIFNPEMIVIGGGVSQSWDLIKEKIEETINKRAMNSLVKDVEILPAELGNDVGVMGAVATALTELDLL